MVAQHLQAHIYVVDLHAKEAFRLYLGGVGHEIAEPVRHGIARHGHHLAVQLLELFQSRIAAGHELPVGIGGRHVAQLYAVVLHPRSPYQVCDEALHPSALHGCVAVHLRREIFQSHTTVECVVELVVLCHEEGQAVHRGQDRHLQCGRVLPQGFLPLLAGQPFRFLV